MHLTFGTHYPPQLRMTDIHNTNDNLQVLAASLPNTIQLISLNQGALQNHNIATPASVTDFDAEVGVN